MDSDCPRVSVLMPVYNAKTEELRAAIDSVLAQTFRDLEFVVVNDGSTDQLVEQTVKAYNDPRIRYFIKENGGIADALNYGLERVRGEYVARMDADDISLPHRLERQVEFLDGHRDYSVVGSWFEFFPGGTVVRHPEEIRALDWFSGCVLAHPSVMFRRADFDRCGLRYDPKWVPAEDYDLWTRAALKLKLGNVQEVLLRYRRSPDGISQTRRQQQEEKTLALRRRYLGELLSSTSVDGFLMNFRQTMIREDRIYRVGRIPLLKVREDDWYRRYLLFGVVPLFKVRMKIGILR